MTIYQNNNKICEHHLNRKAVVYLRQSSDKQVRYNTESTRLQYALADRAKEMGWSDVEVIDSDLGSSAGIGANQRDGFDYLIALVAKKEVGIVMSREVSRLSRTDKDWCRLLEICQIFDTLISDDEQIYDLSLIDDQLILGIKGTMSVVELKVLRMRCIAGMEEKARRGELKRLLPSGYIWDQLDNVVKDPDKRIQEAINMIFKKFRELWAMRQTFLYFHTEGIQLPVNKKKDGKMKIVWQLPTLSFIKGVLTNAFYAGVYVYGRRVTEKVVKDGKIISRTGKALKPEECRVFIKDHHDGYIDWVSYKENQKMINNNRLNLEKDDTVTSIRAGQGLLSGVLRCRRCGRKLHVRYWGKSGTAARYLCKGDFDSGGKYCLGFGGSTVDRRFSKELLKVISPLGMQASLAAMKMLTNKKSDKCKAIENQIKQVEYETQRAFEQYNEVDPRNRLVAGELERRWNEKLEELENMRRQMTETDQEIEALSNEEKKRIMQLGETFKEVWENENCSSESKKKIIRTVVEEIIVDMDEDELLHFIIHWKGGSHTEFKMQKPVSGVGQKTSMEDIEIIRKMGVRYGDDEIARVLNKLGRRTGKGKRWNEQRVMWIRRRNSIAGRKRSTPDKEILTLGRAARYSNVSQGTIKRLVSSGLLNKEQIVPWAPWEIKRADLDSEPVHGIIERLKSTGKLILKRDNSPVQLSLF